MVVFFLRFSSFTFHAVRVLFWYPFGNLLNPLGLLATFCGPYGASWGSPSSEFCWGSWGTKRPRCPQESSRLTKNPPKRPPGPPRSLQNGHKNVPKRLSLFCYRTKTPKLQNTIPQSSNPGSAGCAELLNNISGSNRNTITSTTATSSNIDNANSAGKDGSW